MNTKSVLKFILYGGLTLPFIGCFQGERIIELKTVSPLTIFEKEDDQNDVVLILEALVFESAIGIDKIQINNIDNEYNILAHGKLAGKTRDGNLSFQLSVPGDISNVTFGENRDLLWSRANGIVESPYIRRELNN